jgi:hypothetical protein
VTFVNAVVCLVTHLPIGVYLLASRAVEPTKSPITSIDSERLMRHRQLDQSSNDSASSTSADVASSMADPVLLWTLLPVLFNAVFTPVLLVFMEESVCAAMLRYMQ